MSDDRDEHIAAQVGLNQAVPDNGAGLIAPERKPKHVAIDNAIQTQSCVIDALEDLLCRIQPTPRQDKPCDTNKPPTPSLADFLETAASDIRGNTERMRSLIVEIEGHLF